MTKEELQVNTQRAEEKVVARVKRRASLNKDPHI